MLRLSTTKAPTSTTYYKIGQFSVEERTLDKQHGVYYYPTAADRQEAGYFLYLNQYTAVGDFNGDGWQDIVLDWTVMPHTAPRDFGATPTVYFNDGHGGLRLATSAEVAAMPTIHKGNRFVTGDFNGDGVTDFARASEGLNQRNADGTYTTRYDPLTLMLSAPGGRIVNATANIQGQENGAPTSGYSVGHDLSTGDVDGDGDLDLFSGKVLLLNDGAGRFTNAQALLPTNAKPSHLILTTSAIADFDKNGKSDIYVGWIDGTQYLFRSNWDGANFNWVETKLPAGLFGANTKPNDSKAADINGDGLVDLIVAQTRDVPYYQGAALQILINKGGGQFADETSARIDNTWRDAWQGEGQLDVRDIDGDGDLDILHSNDWKFDASTGTIVAGGLAVALNDGTGKFHWLPQSLFADVKPYQLQGFEAYEPYQLRPLARLYPIDLDKSGSLDFLGVVQKPLSAWPQAEPNVYATYTVLSQTSLGAPAAALNAAALNILREAPGGAAATLVTATAVKVLGGTMTAAAAIGELVKAADATTSVATLAYQFFTGKIPGLGGIDYLVSPTGPNPNNLNSAYYQSFNLENRYINFAVNLGREGEGKAQFQAEYGALSLAQATKLAYDEIFGTAPSDAKVAALLSGGRDLYFQAYGQDGPNGLGTKAAMVGWLLAEAEKADLGQYARANAAFLTDLADGANFAVDLIGTYGKAEYDYGG